MQLPVDSPEEKAFAGCARESRDNARTPMQWSDAEKCWFYNRKALAEGQSELS